MASREYVGSGGLRLTLDEPLSPEMAKQVAAGQLRAVDGEPVDADGVNKALVVGHGSEANTATRVGTHRRTPGDKPAEGAPAGEWATYAVARGLEATQASTLSASQLQEWVAAQEPEDGQDELPTDGDSPSDAERPAKSAPVADWRAYAAARGMDADAEKATKGDCQDYIQVLDDAAGE